MAKKSEKKIEANRQKVIVKYMTAITICTTIGLLGRLIRFDIFNKWEIAEFLFLGLVNYFVYNGIDNSLELGVDYEGNFDLFIINNTVLVLSVLTKWFWALYLSVPLYFVFKILKFCWGQLSVTKEPTTAEDEDDPKKKKKERREKIKYVKS